MSYVPSYNNKQNIRHESTMAEVPEVCRLLMRIIVFYCSFRFPVPVKVSIDG